MNKCERCGSHAINHHAHGRDGSDPNLCDVCYWRKRAEILTGAINAAHESIFTQCVGNPVFNTLGKQVDLTAINHMK